MALLSSFGKSQGRSVGPPFCQPYITCDQIKRDNCGHGISLIVHEFPSIVEATAVHRAHDGFCIVLWFLIAMADAVQYPRIVQKTRSKILISRMPLDQLSMPSFQTSSLRFSSQTLQKVPTPPASFLE